jgi:hypothetical protein
LERRLQAFERSLGKVEAALQANPQENLSQRMAAMERALLQVETVLGSNDLAPRQNSVSNSGNGGTGAADFSPDGPLNEGAEPQSALRQLREVLDEYCTSAEARERRQETHIASLLDGMQGLQQQLREQAVWQITHTQYVQGLQQQLREQAVWQATHTQNVRGLQQQFQEQALWQDTHMQHVQELQQQFREQASWQDTHTQHIQGLQQQFREQALWQATHMQHIQGLQQQFREQALQQANHLRHAECRASAGPHFQLDSHLTAPQKTTDAQQTELEAHTQKGDLPDTTKAETQHSSPPRHSRETCSPLGSIFTTPASSGHAPVGFAHRNHLQGSPDDTAQRKSRDALLHKVYEIANARKFDT